jgi:CRISPR/Cas system endoribonuclease Cas6 (RAMP superfamily)
MGYNRKDLQFIIFKINKIRIQSIAKKEIYTTLSPI